MTVTRNGSVLLYRAGRLRFVIGALLLVPFTVLIAWLAYDGILVDDTEVTGAWLTIPVLGLYIWFDYMLFAKLVWPPELEVSAQGIRWANYAIFQWPASYGWQDIDGPELTSGANGVPLLQIVVKKTGRKLKLQPSHFGATYDEMEAAISAARAGKLISPDAWRSEHPQHRFRHWLLDWGLPISLGIVVAIVLGWFKQ
jgi:hypothetical protein